MRRIETGSLIEDFKEEAGAHIETIESAFLDLRSLSADPGRIDGVFRAAHSLKGTAGFFSLKKIVAIAHELESVFSLIKNGELKPTEEIADAVMESVDSLKALTDGLNTRESIDVERILKSLEKLKPSSARGVYAEKTAEVSVAVPFNLADPDISKAVKSAAKRGQTVYYLRIDFNGALGRYYEAPRALVEDITSVGSVLGAMFDGSPAGTENLSEALSEATARRKQGLLLELLVVSVLEPELFLIAVELDGSLVHAVPREITAGGQTTDPAARKDVAAPYGGGGMMRPQKRGGDFSIRMDVSVVDGLMDLANEMILTRNQLLSAVSGHTKKITGLAPVLHDVSRLTSEIQEKVMLARMQPINVIFSKFPRIVRDMAKTLGKTIRVELSGGEVALDKYILDSLSDPITQIVKNSADHGIESAEDRQLAGKPQEGVIALNAFLRDGSAIVEIKDDGGGIDLEALAQKCLERGLLTRERIGEMSDTELAAMIFEPGLSTAKKVTEVSGRGVGMDIVKANIEQLGGSIEIESEREAGTVVRLKLPPSLSVTRALIVSINSSLYAVPESNVERIVRITELTPTKRLERVNNSLMLNLDGWVLPVVTMDEIDRKAGGGFSGGEREPPAKRRHKNAAAVEKCLVLKAGSMHFALMIDDALETEETLVKPVPPYLKRCRCYSGVTVLGNGQAIVILDTEGIMRFMGIAGVKRAAREEDTAGPDKDLRQVIVFRCSGAEYFALDAEHIRRIDRVEHDALQEIGSELYVNLSGRTTRVLRPEDFAPVKKQSYGQNWLYMLTLNCSEPPVCFLAGKVMDKIDERPRVDEERFKTGYVLGTGAYREKVLLFLDPVGIVSEAEAVRFG